MLNPNERLKYLSQVANDFHVDRRQPIRRYYQSGNQMLKMGNVYYSEQNYESAYVLYLKYLTLFVEKIREHPDFKMVSAAEKNHTSLNAKEVMKKSEKIKATLKLKFENEFSEFQKIEQQRLEKEEEERLKREEQEKLLEVSKYQDEKERNVAIQRDHDVALFHQIQADKEFEMEQLKLAIDKSLADEQKPEFDRSFKPSAPIGSVEPSIPDRSTKPQNIGLYRVTEDGLRNVIVPSMVMAKFLSLAQSNTAKNIETCAILAGKLSQNAFRITHVLVPKQKGTSDSCQTFGEEELFEYQDKHDLITLGWIHTHPSQTAFLSSVDLHTHLSYQLMLPEAVAIVCSPKFNETGFFILTPNHGLHFIGSCKETGFHPHPKEPPLFEEGKHVELDHNGDVQLVDLR